MVWISIDFIASLVRTTLQIQLYSNIERDVLLFNERKNERMDGRTNYMQTFILTFVMNYKLVVSLSE